MTDKKKNIDYKKIMNTLSKNYWTISTVVLAVLLIAVLISGSGATISSAVAGQRVLDFANNQGISAELVSVNDDGSLYEVVLSMDGQEFPVLVTKDGKSLIPAQYVTPLTIAETPAAPSTPAPVTAEVVKSDKPTAELFVMTHCPYGTQAEKGFIPVLESFDKADAKIRFVHYFMHEPEETETPRQVCIREEQSDKFLPYLREFLKEGDSTAALTAANIDTEKMDTCISSGKWEEYYDEDKTLSESYGVRGSPALVVNGVVTQSGRDPASYLSTICSAFNNAPAECSTLTLSSAAPSPMWGWNDSGSNTAAQC